MVCCFDSADFACSGPKVHISTCCGAMKAVELSCRSGYPGSPFNPGSFRKKVEGADASHDAGWALLH